MVGIIILDKKPEKCLDCQFCREIMEGVEACCELTIDEHDTDLFKMINGDYCQEIPKWCPIKSLPEIMDIKKADIHTLIDFGFISGWNTCIKTILNKHTD